jgi:hypothetical protein
MAAKVVWHRAAAWSKLTSMPLPALIAVTLVSIGSAAFIVSGVKTLRRRKRNLLHYERDEPLEGAGDWD